MLQINLVDSALFIKQLFLFQDPFLLFMDEINEKMGTLDEIQIRAEATTLEYFYNNTQVSSILVLIALYQQRYIMPHNDEVSDQTISASIT